MLYNAFGWDPPRFAHVGLLTDEEGQKLSKRNGNIDISSFRDDHILPAALLNYAILLGWSPSRHLPTTSEVLDLQEMIDQVFCPLSCDAHLALANGIPVPPPLYKGEHQSQQKIEPFPLEAHAQNDAIHDTAKDQDPDLPGTKRVDSEI